MVTDFDGKYTIRVSKGSTYLIFSSVGYKTKEVKIDEDSTSSVLNILMSPSISDLNEVVVLGYGSNKSKSSIVGQIAQVKGNVVQDKPVANVFDALQGKVAGLQIFTSSGEPSSLSSIRLLGSGSLGADSTPLFVLDGVQVSQRTIFSLNQQDIEKITVLKDASSTSIYGARAANGVIYVTTKRGKSGKEAVISVDMQYGWTDFINRDYFNGFFNSQQLLDFQAETGYKTKEQVDELREKYPYDTKWFDVYYRPNRPNSQYNISASGGQGKIQYFVSGGYLQQEGAAYQSDYDRLSLRSNISADVKKYLKIGINVGATLSNSVNNSNTGASPSLGLSMLAQPFYTPNDPKTGERYETIPGWARQHPAYLAEKLPSNNERIILTPVGFVEFKPIRGLTIKSQMGLNINQLRLTSKRLPSWSGSLNDGRTTEDFQRNIDRTFTNTAEYIFDLGIDNHFTALVGQELRDNIFTRFRAESTGQTDDRLTLLGNGPDNRTVLSSKTEYIFNSYFGRLEYSLMNKYSASVSLRQDGSSRFSENNRTAMFWSAGISWNAKKESLLKDLDWLKSLAVKFSIGTSGNSSIGNYASLPLVGSGTSAQYDSNTGFFISNPGTSNLTWEKQRLTTLAINFNVFDRINAEFSLYQRVTTDMLVNVPYPFTSGFSSIDKNVGRLDNLGVTSTLNFTFLKGKDWDLGGYVNFNFNQEIIQEIFQGRDFYVIPNTGISWEVGEPRTFLYPLFYRVNPDTGDPEWYNRGEKETETLKDPNNVTSTFNSTELQQNTGKRLSAPLIGGFGLNAKYKGIYMNADFTYAGGKYLINNNRFFFENPSTFLGFNQLNTVTDYWKKKGDLTTFPRYGSGNFTQFDDRLIEDASFIRFKNLTIGYVFPKKWLEKTKLFSSARVFFVARNVLTFTKYTGVDPEIDGNLALGNYPNSRQTSVGLSFNF